MGIARLLEREEDHELLQELRRMLVGSSGEDKPHLPQGSFSFKSASADDDTEDKLVCVTSGVSFLGLALVNCLLLRGYSVRIIVDNSVDVEKLREMTTANVRVSVVMAKLAEVESLSQAFQGCCGVFHTSGYTDPAGLSGYTKTMAEIEVKASENVMRACVTASVRKCVLTSSLLACVWQEQDVSQNDLSPIPVINHDSWSNESLCIDKKLWYALGKLRAEKAAWTLAKETGLKLTTICPGLITGPEFCSRNPTATIAYLKGAQQMYQSGALATVDVTRLAEAHISVYEAMNRSAFGRYICFDQVTETEKQAEKLAGETSLSTNKICGNEERSSIVHHFRYELSNRKLTNLLSRTLRSCYNQNQEYH